MATRGITHDEIHKLANDNKFVSTVQNAVLHKCIYMYDLHRPTVIDTDGFSTMTNQAKAEWNFSFTSLGQGAISNNTGFARLFATFLKNDNVGVDIPEEGGVEVFNARIITDILVDAEIISRDNAQLNKVWNIFLETVGIATPVESWING